MQNINREHLRQVVNEGIVKIRFIKKNGEERLMRCSTNVLYIPVVERKTDNPAKVPNSEILNVVDVELRKWRSIRYDSIEAYMVEGEVSILLQEKHENIMEVLSA